MRREGKINNTEADECTASKVKNIDLELFSSRNRCTNEAGWFKM